MVFSCSMVIGNFNDDTILMYDFHDHYAFGEEKY